MKKTLVLCAQSAAALSVQAQHIVDTAASLAIPQ